MYNASKFVFNNRPRCSKLTLALTLTLDSKTKLTLERGTNPTKP